MTPTFNFPTNSYKLKTDKANYEIYGAMTGGGPRVNVFVNNQLVLDGFVFEHTFRGGVSVSVTDNGHFIVGAGRGGAPRKRNLTTGEDIFVGDPNSRFGITLGRNGRAWPGYINGTHYSFDIRTPAKPVKEPNLFHGTPHPIKPGDPQDFEDQIEKIPLSQQKLLLNNNCKLWIYNAISIVDLPEWAHLRGVPTSAGGDNGRTYNQVSALQSNKVVWVNKFSKLFTLHEMGHTFQDLVGTSDPEWIDIWRRMSWEQPYEKLNSNEAFANSYNYELLKSSRFPEVSQYLRRKLPWN